MEKSLAKMGDDMAIESVYIKLKQQMKPGLDAILEKIENESERRDLEIKLDNELRSYVKVVINSQKKGKPFSKEKKMNFMKIKL